MITHKHSLLEIIAAVAHADGVRPEDVLAGTRDWGRMCGRFVVIYMAREDRRSLSEIGRAVGRDHTTILSAIRRIDQYRERNETRWQQMQDLVRLASVVLERGDTAVRVPRRLAEADIATAVMAVVRIVCARTDTSAADVMGTRSPGSITSARRIAVWLIAEGLAVQVTSIAGMFRRRSGTMGRMLRDFDAAVLSEPWHHLCRVIRGTAFLHDGVAKLSAMAEREEAVARARQNGLRPSVGAGINVFRWASRARDLRKRGWSIKGIAKQCHARPDDVAVVIGETAYGHREPATCASAGGRSRASQSNATPGPTTSPSSSARRPRGIQSRR